MDIQTEIETMYSDQDFEVVSGPITDNYLMRAWAATNLAFNPETEISYALHQGTLNLLKMVPMPQEVRDVRNRGKFASAVQRHRAWISRSIQHNEAVSGANVPYVH